ncbi:hypothetical protein REPUB_Repub04eG0185800 [Reevesia pubescens]
MGFHHYSHCCHVLAFLYPLAVFQPFSTLVTQIQTLAVSCTHPPKGLTYFHTPVGRDYEGRLLIDFIGFEHPLVACCGHGGKYNYNRFIHCGDTIKVNGKETLVANSCKNLSVRINWDGTHLIEAAVDNRTNCQWFLFRPANSTENGL